MTNLEAQEMAAAITAEPVVEQAVVEAAPVAAPVVDDEFTDADRAAVMKALKSEREQRKATEDELKKFRAAEDDARKASMSELERAVSEARASGRQEAETQYKATLLKARVEAKATGRFHDSDMILSLIDVDGDATDAEIDAALSGLAEARPYLVKHAVPNLPQGPRGENVAAKSMDDVFREALMSRR